MTIHHTLTFLLLAAFLAALGMQWLLMRRMGRSLEQFQRQKLTDQIRRGTQQENVDAVSGPVSNGVSDDTQHE